VVEGGIPSRFKEFKNEILVSLRYWEDGEWVVVGGGDTTPLQTIQIQNVVRRDTLFIYIYPRDVLVEVLNAHLH
jgi:hypothetical protein